MGEPTCEISACQLRTKLGVIFPRGTSPSWGTMYLPSSQSYNSRVRTFRSGLLSSQSCDHWAIVDYGRALRRLVQGHQSGARDRVERPLGRLSPVRWKIVVIALLLAAIAPAMFTHVAQLTVEAALDVLRQLVGGRHG